MNINKKCFTPQIEPHTANYGFLLFGSILWEIRREFLFLDIKVTISETSTENFRKFVFCYNVWKGPILRKIWISLKSFFLSNQ